MSFVLLCCQPSKISWEKGRTVMRKAGPPCFTDNRNERGRGSSFESGQYSDHFGGPVGRPSHISAHSAGIPQRANTANRCHIENDHTGRATGEIALMKSTAAFVHWNGVGAGKSQPHPRPSSKCR